MDIPTTQPFKHTFLSEFTITPSLLPFSDTQLQYIDSELSQYEKIFLDPDIEKNLYSKNELLASFAISKAENSTLTLQEAQNVYNLVTSNQELTFINDKIHNKQKLTQKDYEKLEFYNIARVFRKINEQTIRIEGVTPSFLQELHQELTLGFDIFKQYLFDLTVYKSGQWRDNNEIRVGNYVPASYTAIEKGVEELLDWIKSNQTITSIGIFHTALYALHPFNNGNKRVCRILEHIFLRSIGMNKRNLYSTSYYYHKEKERYYKYLLASLERRNLTYFVSYFQEAFFLSIVATVKTSLEIRRSQFVNQQENLNDQLKIIIKPLYKRKELQYKTLRKIVKEKMAEQTFVTYLQQGVDKGILKKRESGRAVYYSINLNIEEEKIIHNWLVLAKEKLQFIPDSIKLA
jgi:Fic family protein